MSRTAFLALHSHTDARPAAVALLRRLQRGCVELLLRLAAAERERRERQQMAELCDATLRDLGLSRADIWAELNKADWRR